MNLGVLLIVIGIICLVFGGAAGIVVGVAFCTLGLVLILQTRNL